MSRLLLFALVPAVVVAAFCCGWSLRSVTAGRTEIKGEASAEPVGYHVDAGDVFFNDYVFSADSRTFTVVYDRHDGGPKFARDMNKFYYNGQNIGGCDSASFSPVLIDGQFAGYATDTKAVYAFYRDNSYNYQYIVLSGLSPTTFRLVTDPNNNGGQYAVDDGSVFYISSGGPQPPTASILPTADASNFQLLTPTDARKTSGGCEAVSGQLCFVATSTTTL